MSTGAEALALDTQGGNRAIGVVVGMFAGSRWVLCVGSWRCLRRQRVGCLLRVLLPFMVLDFVCLRSCALIG